MAIPMTKTSAHPRRLPRSTMRFPSQEGGDTRPNSCIKRGAAESFDRLDEYLASVAIGSYHLGEKLGSGGMGEVYSATHTMLARPAAIKLIRPEALGGGNSDAAQLALRRFAREAEAAANLRSPHTVEVYDFGVTEDQTLYFVMEMLDGMDLESLVGQSGALPAGRVIYIVRQIGRAHV